MKDVFEAAKAEYAKLELLAQKYGGAEAEPLMCALDRLLQTVLFSAAQGDGVYLSGESSFISQVVKHGDVLKSYNLHMGAGLKKTVTWEDLVFLPGPGKRQLQEALIQEMLGSAEPIARACKDENPAARAFEGQVIAIAGYFAGIDEMQRGCEITELVTEAAIDITKQFLAKIQSY